MEYVRPKLSAEASTKMQVSYQYMRGSCKEGRMYPIESPVNPSVSPTSASVCDPSTGR